ncbi:MAG: Hsp33 family molecular chaperone HslO [Pseudomonadota bacterium]|jgi:molecular chaperone Hsp33|nr:Hsp33 family molecular chaperone [Alphaproteobacteria bacterium]
MQPAHDYEPDDVVLPFAVENADVRGRITRLGPLADEVLRRHAYPEAVSHLLGEALCLLALLGSTLKIRGSLSLQTKGDGPVRLLIADCVSDGGGKVNLRGYAGFDREADYTGLDHAFSRLVGQGYFALTIDPGGDADRYQGIVALEGASLSECAERYFLTSEQIPTSIKLAVGRVYAREAGRFAPEADAGHWRAGGVMIQHLPRRQDLVRAPEDPLDEHEDWRRCRILMQTASEAELLEPRLASEELLYRLFHEDGVRVFPGARAVFGCRCSRERLAGLLRQYPREELAELLQDGHITGNCEFCNEAYRFTLEELVPEMAP